MPAYVHLIRIDWHYERADAALKSSLPAINERMTSSDHTYDTFLEQLRAIATAQPTLVADALIEDGYRAYFLVRVRAGRVEVAPVDERPEDAMADPIALPLDEIVHVALVRDRDDITARLVEIDDAVDDGVGDDDAELPLPLVYPDLASLNAIVERVARAIDTGGGAFVAQVELDRYLVEVAPGSARIRKLLVATEPALVARLLREDYARVPPAPRERDRKYEIGLYWPEDMLRFMQDAALRVDGSLSSVAQEAFAHARYTIAQSERSVLAEALRSFGAGVTVRKQTLYIPGEMLDAMERQATRLDASVSFVAQCAVALARSAISARPSR